MNDITQHLSGAYAAARLAASGEHSQPVTHILQRVLWTVVTLVVLAGVYWLMWRGWKKRQARQAGIDAPPAAPAGAFPAGGGGVEALYISTTSEGDWLDRIAVHGLGERSNATVRVAPAGVLVEREPADVFIPAAAIRGVRPVTGMAGKYLREEGIVVVTWQHGEHTLDTGLLPRYDTDREALLESVKALQSLQNPQSERSAT